MIEFDRNGVCTRDRRESALAKNKNTPHLSSNQSILQPPPKLGYPQGYDQLTPINMDLSSQIENQFQGLTNLDMDQQIDRLQQRGSTNYDQNSSIHGQTPLDRQTYFSDQNQSIYNPHADHLNQQLQQMSKQMPENKNSIFTQFQNMDALHNLTNVPKMQTVDTMNFQRPTSSNLK
jgi:hypothetical protein